MAATAHVPACEGTIQSTVAADPAELECSLRLPQQYIAIGH